MGGVLLLPHQNMPDTGIINCIVKWTDGSARVAEYDIDTLLLETFDHDFRAVYLFHTCHPLRCKNGAIAGFADCRSLINEAVPVKTEADRTQLLQDDVVGGGLLCCQDMGAVGCFI